jgi:hypothetical protein
MAYNPSQYGNALDKPSSYLPVVHIKLRHFSDIHGTLTHTLPQVSNQADAIKIACHFISIEHLAETQRICNEFRQQRLSTSAGDDVLQFYITLWHAWKSLTQDQVFHDAPDVSSISPPPLEATRPISRHRKDKNRAIKKARLLAQCPHRPGYDFRCPFCPRMFHRAGLLDHLYVLIRSPPPILT